MRNFIIVLIVFLTVLSSTTAQQIEEFKASGKPLMTVFANYNSTISEGKASNRFVLTRAYFGYNYNFSESVSARLGFDVGDPKDGGRYDMTAFVKHAFLSYSQNKLSVNFGMIRTTAFRVQQQAWGYRYISKTLQNINKFGPSADLGISTAYNFNENISADFIITNGEGYKNVESDSIFSIGVGLTIKPLNKVTFRGYYETGSGESEYVNDEGEQADLVRHNTISFFGSYAVDKFSFSAECAAQLNNDNLENHDLNGFSMYSTYIVKSSKIFTRVDYLSSMKEWESGREGTRIIIGAEFNPVKGIKIAPNYRSFISDAEGGEDVQYVFANCQIKF